MLELQDVHSHYGGSHVLEESHSELKRVRWLRFLDETEPGKTTTLSGNGIIPGQGVNIKFTGEDITNRKPYPIAQTGCWLRA